MGRRPCCEKVGLNRGAWSALEDEILTNYIKANGEGKWRDLPKKAGLKRCGKSCRLRWLNYLNPSIIRGNITPEEEELIVKLHKNLGNRRSLIAGRLPWRTDNEIKNYWNTILHKKVHGDHPCSALPRRKPKKKSDKKYSNSTAKSQAIPSPTLVHPSIIVPCNEDIIFAIQQPAPCQDHSNPHQASHSADEETMEFGSGMNLVDMDKWLGFFFEEEMNAPIWYEETFAYGELSSMPALSSDDYMFHCWTENTYIEENNMFDF